MDLLERYVQAVGQHLAADAPNDVLAELRENLRAQMDAAAEGREGPLTESEIAALLRAHGRPMLVAARYGPQRSLIGPELFPVYLHTLKRAAPLVVLAWLIAHIATFLFSSDPGALLAGAGAALLQLVPVLLIFWSIVTLTFAMLEYAQNHQEEGIGWNRWDPAKLPPLNKPTAGKSRTTRIVDLVVHCLWMAYVFAIPHHLYLVMGPGASWLTRLHVTLAPVWRPVYMAIVVVVTAQLVIKLVALTELEHSWERPLVLVTKIAGIVPTALLAYAKIYVLPTGVAANVDTLIHINRYLNAGFRIALLMAVISLAIDSWQYLRRYVTTPRLAF